MIWRVYFVSIPTSGIVVFLLYRTQRPGERLSGFHPDVRDCYCCARVAISRKRIFHPDVRDCYGWDALRDPQHHASIPTCGIVTPTGLGKRQRH